MPTQKTDRTTQWNVTASNKTWTLTKNAEIAVVDQHGIDENVYDNSTIKVLGDITLKGAGYAGVRIIGDTSAVLVGKDSRVNAKQAEYGVQSEGKGTEIVNRGRIEGGDYGIDADRSLVRNFGVVTGDYAMNFSSGGSQIYNYGRIQGTDHGIHSLAFEAYVENAEGSKILGDEIAVELEGPGIATLVNKGLIRSTDIAVQSDDGNMDITNSGRIVGDIHLGASNDIFDTREGEIVGDVYGGGGNDIYLIGKSHLTIIEGFGFGAGYDTLRSTATITMAANVEDLFLLGRMDIDGTGNGADNFMYGNKGDNDLYGLAGSDVLSGRGGDDRLTGGEMSDIFVFADNFGIDRITDFEDGTDQLLIYGISSQQDLDAADIQEKNGDLIIDMGNGNKIIVKDMALSDLSYAQDFSLPF